MKVFVITQENPKTGESSVYGVYEEEQYCYFVADELAERYKEFAFAYQTFDTIQEKKLKGETK